MLSQWRKNFSIFVKRPDFTVKKLVGTAILSLIILFIHNPGCLAIIALSWVVLFFMSAIKWHQIKPFIWVIASTAFLFY